MKHVKRLALAGFLGITLLGLALLPAFDAGALKPRCGDQRDGTWNAGTNTCGGAASNCTDITVCG